MLYSLCDGDLLKLEAIEKKPVKQSMHWMAYMVDRAYLDKELLKQTK